VKISWPLQSEPFINFIYRNWLGKDYHWLGLNAGLLLNEVAVTGWLNSNYVRVVAF
jgi:hypothetical protein